MTPITKSSRNMGHSFHSFTVSLLLLLSFSLFLSSFKGREKSRNDLKIHVRSNANSMRVIKMEGDSGSLQFNNTTPARKWSNFTMSGAGNGIEFSSQARLEDDSGFSSPPLWKTSETSPSPSRSSPLHHLHQHQFSPNSRLKAIARGQQELMEMVQNMGDSTYDLSLRDMVELPKISSRVQRPELPSEYIQGKRTPIKKARIKKARSTPKTQGLRSGNIGNGDFLLNIFLPASLKRTRSVDGRVSPLKGSDGEWWKKRSFGLAEAGRSSSRSSKSSSRRRTMDGALSGCWSFLHKNKRKEQTL